MLSLFKHPDQPDRATLECIWGGTSYFSANSRWASVQITLFFLVRLVPQKYIYIIFKMNLHTKMLPVKSATQVATQPLLEFHSVKHKSFREDSAVVVRTIMFQFCFQLNTHTFICWIPECWPLHYECVRASQMFFLFGCVFSRCTNKCVFR